MTLKNAFENLAVESKQDTQITQLGATNEAAPASDIAVSGLNGRAQRIAQRMSSLIGLLPVSLGQKVRAASLAVTLSTEDVAALTPSGTVTGNVEVTNDAGNPLPISGTVTATGPLTDTQLRATPVPVSGTVTATTGGLTDTQLRATPVPISGTVTANTGLSQPLTDTQLRAAGVPVSDGGGSLTVDSPAIPTTAGQKARTASLGVTLSTEDVAALTPPAAITGYATAANQTTELASLASVKTNTDNRYSGGKTAVVATVTASGDTTIHTPAAGKAIRLFWITAINDPDEAATPLIKIGFGPSTAITKERYRVFAVGHWEVFEGAPDDRLIVNLSAAASIAVTAHIQEF